MILKSILILHRYMGVVLGVLMTVWCLSGFVMMYQGFPAASGEERRAGLQTLDLSACCVADFGIGDGEEISSLQIEMRASEPVMRLAARGERTILRLEDGQAAAGLAQEDIEAIARSFMEGNGQNTGVGSAHQIRVDQWTAQTARRNAPVWRIKFDDPGRSWVYVNERTGEVFQHATISERWLSWFGAVPHWLYPTLLRENQTLWYQTVIWLAAAGTFLTVTGVVIGVAKLRGKSGQWWPYKRPVWLWHHMFGVFAGVLVLTWTFSGLLTMQPWGLFETPSTVQRSAVVTPMKWGQIRPLLSELEAHAGREGLVRIRAVSLLGETHLIAEYRDGDTLRIGENGPDPLQIDTVVRNAGRMQGIISSAEIDLLETEDAYYYGHKQPADLPVVRLQLGDDQKSRIYLDPETGDVRRFVGGTQKRYRWLESGLHSFDFPVLKARPVWDIIVLLLLAAVTVVCATGAWMSFSRVKRDVSALQRWLQRSRT